MNKVKKTVALGLTLIAITALVGIIFLVTITVMNAASVTGAVAAVLVVTLIFLVIIVFMCAGVVIGMYDWSSNTENQIESWKMLSEYDEELKEAKKNGKQNNV